MEQSSGIDPLTCGRSLYFIDVLFHNGFFVFNSFFIVLEDCEVIESPQKKEGASDTNEEEKIN